MEESKLNSNRQIILSFGFELLQFLDGSRDEPFFGKSFGALDANVGGLRIE